MTVKNLMAMLESFADDSEIAVEIVKDGDEPFITYDISFGCSEFEEFVMQVHE